VGFRPSRSGEDQAARGPRAGADGRVGGGRGRDAGLLLHLDSAFFGEQTLRILVYTAPFVAPLANSGVGLLLILDRMVDARSVE